MTLGEKELFSCRFSCGIASYPDFDTGIMISDEADKALYITKESVRNQTMIADITTVAT